MRRAPLAPVLGVLAALAAASPARAERAALHDIAWYMANAKARAATLSLCRSDHTFDRDPDCHNAESAELNLWADRSAARARDAAPPGAAPAPAPARPKRPPTPGELLTSPTYWAENRLARVGVLAACRVPGSIYTADTCAAARRADAADPTRGKR